MQGEGKLDEDDDKQQQFEQHPQPPVQPTSPPKEKNQQQMNQQYNPQQPQEQELQQKIYEEENVRKALKEQLLRDQAEMRAKRELQERQEALYLEQERQKVKGPLHDSPEDSDPNIGDPIPVEDDNQETSDSHTIRAFEEEEEDYEIANPLKGHVEQVEPEVKDDWNPTGLSDLFASDDDVKKTVEDDNDDAPGSIMPPLHDDSNPEEEESEEQPEEAEPEPETPESIEAERLYQAGEKLINATYYKEYKEAYLNFQRAADLNHKKAKEMVAFGHLFGDYLPQNITRAQELFVERAGQGSPTAQMGLAFMYSAGFYYNSSQAKALIYSTFGALGGEPLAQMMLGYRYYAGIGVESKCESALTYYRKVATKVADSVTTGGGPVVQRIRLQEEQENAGTSNSPLLDDDLLQYYHFLADKGDQQAQVVLGTLYYQGGKGVQINHEQAYHYFSTAAEGGSGHALGYLGKMHSEGSPLVKQSNHTSFEFFKKSADKNNHIGQAGLGMMYLNGLGIDKDTGKAFRFFSLASDQGSVDGQLQLGIMYFSGIGVRKDYKMAVKYFTMASQNGHVLAFYNLAQMHATGTGVLRNCHTAVELFKNVAERGRWSEQLMDAHRMYTEGSVDTAIIKYMFLAELGYEVAQSNVAYLLDTGATEKFGNLETYQRALLQFSRAASQGSAQARLKMGDYHFYGFGTEVDYESAASHYRIASETQHNAQAMFNLGYMHERGLGLKQDVHLAKRFYDMAADTSLDAYVPVALALCKLAVFYGMDVFSKEFEGMNSLLQLLDPMAVFGPEWDLYLAAILGLTIGIIFVFRRR